MRALSTLALAAALSLSAPVATDLAADLTANLSPTLSAALDGAFSAEAGFIRRGKLKKRPVTSYKVVVITESNEADPNDTAIDSLDVTFPSVGEAGSGDQLAVSGSLRRNGSKHFKGLITQYPATSSFSVTVNNDDGSTSVLEVPIEGLDPTQVGSETTVVTDLGIKAQLRVLNADGLLKVRVFHEDGAWDTSMVSEVAVAGVPLPYVRTTQRWTQLVDDSGLSPDFGEGSSYTMKVVAKDAAGNVLDASTSSESLGSADGPDIAKVRVTETACGALKVVTTTDSVNGRASSMQVLASTPDGEPLLTALDDMPASSENLWASTTHTFEDPEGAVGQPYGVVVMAFGAGDKFLGGADLEIVVEGLDEGTTLTPPVGKPFAIVSGEAELSGRLAVKRSDLTNYSLSVTLDSDLVERVDVQLVDLVGNASIPESSSFDTPVYSVRRWKSRGACDASYGVGDVQITVLMLDVDDNPLDTVNATAAAFPQTVYKRAGGGFDAGGTATINSSIIDLNP